MCTNMPQSSLRLARFCQRQVQNGIINQQLKNLPAVETGQKNFEVLQSFGIVEKFKIVKFKNLKVLLASEKFRNAYEP